MPEDMLVRVNNPRRHTPTALPENARWSNKTRKNLMRFRVVLQSFPWSIPHRVLHPELTELNVGANQLAGRSVACRTSHF